MFIHVFFLFSIQLVAGREIIKWRLRLITSVVLFEKKTANLWGSFQIGMW